MANLIRGVFDALSFQKVLPLLGSCKPAAATTAKIISSNVAVFIASYGLSTFVIQPATALLSTGGSWETCWDAAPSLMIHLAWSLPLYIYCYTTSVAGYQQLADQYYKHLHDKQPLKKKADSALLGTLLWLYIFIHGQILVSAMPLVTSRLKSSAVRPYVDTAVTIVDSAAFVIGHLVQALLCSWYFTEPYQISSGKGLDARLALLEQRWLYFAGFGLPYVVLAKSLPYYHNLGCYLFCFPFAVTLGCVIDSGASPKKSVKTSSSYSIFTRALPVFLIAKRQAVYTIQALDFVRGRLTMGDKGGKGKSKGKAKGKGKKVD